MRVLLVDDEAELVSTLAERLSLRGIEADWVTIGEEALERVESETYDICVLDVKIPKISGLKLKTLLQKECPGMKFVFMTGHGSEDVLQAVSAYRRKQPFRLYSRLLRHRRQARHNN